MIFDELDSAKENYTIFSFDLNGLKNINDTYGHNAGDAVLGHVAEVLQENVGLDDETVRWGGEEFILLLCGKDRQQAREAAEEIRLKMLREVCLYEGEEIRVTMSFGVEEIDTALSVEENVRRADEKLYEAKKTGRNKVV